VTQKNTIWVEPEDLTCLLNPNQTRLVRYLRGKNRIMFDDLAVETNRTAKALNRDLSILSEYQLVRIFDEKDPESNSVRKVIEPTFGDQMLELRAEI